MSDENPWRTNTGVSPGGFVEWRDRAFRTGKAATSSLTWQQIGHTDDITHWRPVRDMRFGYAG